MKAIKIKILSFISDEQPGYVECAFNDAWNNKQIIHEKTPIITDEVLDLNSKYPKDALIACELLNVWIDENDRKIFTVTTERPWLVTTIHGLTVFDVLEVQLTEFSISESK